VNARHIHSARRSSHVQATTPKQPLRSRQLERMPSFLAAGFRERRPRATKLVARILRKVAAKPTAGWALRRGQLVHGVDGPLGYLDALRDYTLEPYAPKIECPTLVCNADGDDISASAPQLVAGLTCEHDFITFTAADGADDHCEAGARTLYHALTFDWLDRRLLPEPQPVTTNMAEVD
jgi:hypothetical protein